MKKRQPWTVQLVLLAALAALGYFGYKSWTYRSSDKFLAPDMKVPDFTFPERSGKDFTSDRLKGKVWVVDFIFAHCAGSCPLLSQQMALLQKEWKGNGNLKLVTFTVDPERDTVEALKKYADDLKADPDQWFFLTGKKDEIYKTIREGFKAAAARDLEAPPGFDYIHSTRLYLIDGRGMVRGMYDGDNESDLKKLHQDVRHLMNSWSKS